MKYQIVLIEGWPAAHGPASTNRGQASVKIKEGADTTLPTTPVLTGTAVKRDIDAPPMLIFHGYKAILNWTASTDNFSVVGYQVCRNGIPYTEVMSPATNYVMYWGWATDVYTIRAFDASGNLSAPSNAFTVVPPPSSPPPINTNIITLSSSWSGKLLTVTSTQNNADTKAQPANPSWSSQNWIIEQVSSSNFRIKNVWSNKYLNVQNQNENSKILCYDLHTDWLSE